MHRIYDITATVAVWLRRAAQPLRSDRGDSPIPSAVIIAGLAIIAVGLLVWLGSYVTSVVNQAPTQLPGSGE